VPSIGHVAVGLACSRLRSPERVGPLAWAGALCALALLPDIDVVAFRLGIPYSAPFGHRGALHSMVAAAIGAALIGLVAWWFGMRPLPIVGIAALVLASHGLLDSMTDGGLGIALFWPFSDRRYFAPWRPIPVAPLGLRILSPHGLGLMLGECLMFLPLFLIGLWPRRGKPWERTQG
jgi:inner membrane protein